MITISEGVALMQQTITASKNILLENGYLNPSLYIFNTKGDTDVESISLGFDVLPTVAEITHVKKETIFKDANITKEDVFLTIVTFFCQVKKDTENIQKIMEVIASTHKPDMMGIVISALFRSFTEKEREHIPKSVLEDPGAVRIIHSVFYTKDETRAFLQNIPFVNRGTLPETSEVPYDITFMDSGWIIENKENVPRFKNPYIS
jgi:hypothetical protein